MSAENQRTYLLNDHERDAIYGVPIFTKEEQDHYFYLSPADEEELKGLHVNSRVHFILQLGYFRAKHLLFDFTFKSVNDDVKYVISRYLPGEKIQKIPLSRKIRANNNNRIAMLHGFKIYAKKIQKRMVAKLAQYIKAFNDRVFPHIQPKSAMDQIFSTKAQII